MRRLLRSAKSFVRESGGQDLIEYVLLVAFIALVLVGAITAAGGEVEVVFNNIANTLGGGGGDGDSGGGGSGDDGSNCLESQVISQGLQAVLVRSMALRIVSNFRMHAMSATFFGLPAATKRR